MKRRKAVLDELYEDLWEEQPGTVNQYAARLHHLGMSEVEVSSPSPRDAPESE